MVVKVARLRDDESRWFVVHRSGLGIRFRFGRGCRAQGKWFTVHGTGQLAALTTAAELS